MPKPVDFSGEKYYNVVITGEEQKEMPEHAYYTYLVRCADGTLYCGYTDDLERRLAVHNSGRGAKYTSRRLPVVLVYSERFDSKSRAMSRECAIKRLTRAEKLALIARGYSGEAKGSL